MRRIGKSAYPLLSLLSRKSQQMRKKVKYFWIVKIGSPAEAAAAPVALS
jgi:hypothetical protein